MTRNSHYVSIEFAPKRRIQGVQIARRASRLFAALHLDRVEQVGPLPINLDDGREDATTVGSKLFVFGSKDELQSLLQPSTHSGRAIVSGGYLVSDIMPVPDDTPHVVCRRVRVDESTRSGMERARRRAEKRGNSPEVVRAIVASRVDREEQIRLTPSFLISSSSTKPTDERKHKLRVFIDVYPVGDAMEGEYTSYGLSKEGSTVPLISQQFP